MAKGPIIALGLLFAIILITIPLIEYLNVGRLSLVGNLTSSSSAGIMTEITANSPTGEYGYTGQYAYIWNNDPTWNYYVYLPANFNSSKTYGLIIGYHGESGSASAYEQNWENDADTYNFILAFPQSATSIWYIPEGSSMATQIISYMRQRYHIGDIFLTGCSAGAKEIFYTALLQPGVYTGVGSVVGDIDFASYTPTPQDFANASGQHFYLINGAQDTDILQQNIENTVSNLTRNGGIVTAKVYNMGHACPVYADDNLSAWFASLETS